MAHVKGLTEEQKEQIRTLLLERKRSIEEDIQKGFTRILKDTSEETTVVDVEEGDASHVDVGMDMSFEVISRRSREWKQIKEALLRLETGDYGMCDECGIPIRFERLKVMPFAQLCRNCQQDSERKEKERQGGGRGTYQP